jgi:flavin-dependent dehydrogenase
LPESVEVLIVGAGPAGAAAALNLAPFRKVLLVDVQERPVRRPGESMIPAVRRLLVDMGLLESFLRQGFEEWHGNSSVWGSERVEERSFLRDLDGNGWHIDRPRFESWLREIAVQRGASLRVPANASRIEREGSGFVATLHSKEGSSKLTAEFVIDAGGRRSSAARSMGAVRHFDLPLICHAIYGHCDAGGAGAGVTFLEAVRDGWWYTSPLPGGQRILAFHTDADLLHGEQLRGSDELLAYASETTFLREILAEGKFEPEGRCFSREAGGSALVPCEGPGWMAAGDAATAFDPLSSQGLFHALYTGLACAEAADRYLGGDRDAAADYRESLQSIRERYRAGLASVYGEERRWSDSEFWKRRQ